MKPIESSGSIRPKESRVLKHLYNGYTPMIAPWLGLKAYREPAKTQSAHLSTESCSPTAPSSMSGLYGGRYSMIQEKSSRSSARLWTLRSEDSRNKSGRNYEIG